MTMRVICELGDVSATYLTGLVVAGRTVDETTGAVDLEDFFTLKTDDGELLEICGWLANTTVCTD